MTVSRKRASVAFAALALTTCFAGAASAAQFGLAPTRVELGGKHAVETIVVTSQQAEPLDFEVHVLRWTQGTDGTWQQVPSDDLVVHPLIVRVGPNGTARIRVGSLSPNVAAEQAYRIELQELPSKIENTGAQIRMLTKVSVPVFVQANGAKPALAVSVAEVDSHGVHLVLDNKGTAYAPPLPAVLRIKDASGRKLSETTVSTNYVLAGARLPVQVKLPAGSCAHAAQLELVPEGETPLVATIAPESRQCAR